MTENEKLLIKQWIGGAYNLFYLMGIPYEKQDITIKSILNMIDKGDMMNLIELKKGLDSLSQAITAGIYEQSKKVHKNDEKKRIKKNFKYI